MAGIPLKKRLAQTLASARRRSFVVGVLAAVALFAIYELNEASSQAAGAMQLLAKATRPASLAGAQDACRVQLSTSCPVTREDAFEEFTSIYKEDKWGNEGLQPHAERQREHGDWRLRVHHQVGAKISRAGYQVRGGRAPRQRDPPTFAPDIFNGSLQPLVADTVPCVIGEGESRTGPRFKTYVRDVANDVAIGGIQNVKRQDV